MPIQFNEADKMTLMRTNQEKLTKSWRNTYNSTHRHSLDKYIKNNYRGYVATLKRCCDKAKPMCFDQWLNHAS